VIGGLSVSTVLTLVFVPTLYFTAESWRAKRRLRVQGIEDSSQIPE